MSEQKPSGRPAKGLGRGLSSLLGDPVASASLTQNKAAAGPDQQNSAGVRQLPVEWINPGPWQPRRRFDSAALKELAISMEKQGLVQPVLVRPNPAEEGRYQLIAGERRWRAAQLAKMHDIPAIIRAMDDKQAAELALVENIQRTDLTAIEEAEAFQQLIDLHGYTQQALADIMGKSRPHIANLLRLLSLPQSVRNDILESRLTSGQARPLIGLENAAELARLIIDKKLNARQAEALAKSGKTGKTDRQKSKKTSDIKAIEKKAAEVLGVNLQLDWDPGKEKGQIRIAVVSLEQMDLILARLGLSG